MLNKIKNSKFVQSATYAVRSTARGTEVLVFAGVGGWLIYSSNDKVTIGVGVALGLVALGKLFRLAFQAERAVKEATK